MGARVPISQTEKSIYFFSNTRIIQAVLQAAEKASLRSVAREIGVPYQRLAAFRDGAKPHPETAIKIVAWYVRTRGLKSRMVFSPDLSALISELVPMLAALSAQRREKLLQAMANEALLRAEIIAQTRLR